MTLEGSTPEIDSTQGAEGVRVLLILSDAGGAKPLDEQTERNLIATAVGEQNVTVFERTSLHDLVQKLPQQRDCTIVHFSCHGSLDLKLKQHVKQRCAARDISIAVSDVQLSGMCARAIRRVLAEPPPADPVPLPLVDDEVVGRAQLESFEAGLVLHPKGRASGHEIVKPDGLAGLFGVCESLQCIVLNACTSHLQGEEFLKQRELARIRYVISVRGRISDKAALLFSEGFYSELPHGKTIESAFAHACAALKAKFSESSREVQVEEEGGLPQLHARPAPVPEPSEERYRFKISMRSPPEDLDTKVAVIDYLVQELKALKLPIRSDEISATELPSTSWQIILTQREGFAITEAEGLRLVEELNDEFELQAAARIRFGAIEHGSVILSVRSPASTLSVVRSRCTAVDGMQLQELRMLGCDVTMIGSGSTYARLSVCGSRLQLELSLPEMELQKPEGAEQQSSGAFGASPAGGAFGAPAASPMEKGGSTVAGLLSSIDRVPQPYRRDEPPPPPPVGPTLEPDDGKIGPSSADGSRAAPVPTQGRKAEKKRLAEQRC